MSFIYYIIIISNRKLNNIIPKFIIFEIFLLYKNKSFSYIKCYNNAIYLILYFVEKRIKYFVGTPYNIDWI